jgi:hypothetical protein
MVDRYRRFGVTCRYIFKIEGQNIETAGFSKTLVHYQQRRRHITKSYNLNAKTRLVTLYRRNTEQQQHKEMNPLVGNVTAEQQLMA